MATSKAPQAFTPTPGRMVVTCPGCGAPIACLALEAVKRAGRLAGHLTVPPASILRGAMDLAAVRCLDCEQKAH